MIPPSRIARRVRPRVNAAVLEARAAELFKRSIKGAAKQAAIEFVVRCTDLTTLEGRDTEGRVRALSARAIAPAAGLPPVAAMCVYPTLVAPAKAALAGSAVKVASVATAFPSGLSPLAIKLAETQAALEAGADEIDMVIDRGAFLAGREAQVAFEIGAVRELCAARGAPLKVILEAGELGSYAAIRRACDLALGAGADFIKTSTGKIGISSTPPIALVMCEALRDFERRSGRIAGLKLAGGIRTTKAALGYLAIVAETLDARWLQPARLRFGASSLLDDLVSQHLTHASGAYAGGSYVASA
jgi:deoxyribose-phosphate aldolase